MVNIKGNHDGSSAVDYTINPATGFPWATGRETSPFRSTTCCRRGTRSPARWRPPACSRPSATGSRTGEGQLVSVALSDVAFAMVGNLGKIAEAQLLRRERPKDGNYLYGAFGRDFITKDGRRIMIVALTLRQWRSLVKATGLGEAFATLEQTLDLDFSREGDRFEAREVLGAVIKPWTVARTLAEIREAFDAPRRVLGAVPDVHGARGPGPALLGREPAVRGGRAAGDRHLPDGRLATGAERVRAACRCVRRPSSASTPRRCSRRCSGWTTPRSDGCTTTVSWPARWPLSARSRPLVRTPLPVACPGRRCLTMRNQFLLEEIPSRRFPDSGMAALDAMRLVDEELMLEGDPQRNLATFVTTWMEPEAQRLIAENLYRNFIDHAEYPISAEIEQRCIRMLADLYNAPGETTGARTQGSSEAIMLGALSLKWKWRERREAAGKPTDKPNLVFGGDVHVVWEKFCRYFDVEPRIVPLQEDKYTIGPEDVEPHVDENTIGVAAVLGTTFTGHADDIVGINKLLVGLKDEKGLDVPLHVDAASGGFVWPFLYPDSEWDFRLEQVRSINVSGHKFGLVYPGIGWLVFREQADLAEDLVFYENYLGKTDATFTLNFSTGASMVLAQYYNFVRLGREGYTLRDGGDGGERAGAGRASSARTATSS